MIPNPLRRVATLVTIGALAVAAGCTVTRPSPVKETYLLDPASPPAVAQAQKGSVRVGTVNVAAPFRGRNFVVRNSELKYETDFYREFIVAPASMVGDDTARALGAARVFASVARPGTAVEADWLLEAFVTSLYADARDPAKPSAVMEVTYYLSRDRGGGAPVWSKAYHRTAPFASTAGEAYVGALNGAFAGILAELARDLATAALPKD